VIFVIFAEVKWFDKILLNRPLRVVVAVILTAIVSPILLYRFLFFTSIELPPSDGYSFGTCLIHRTSRLPCGLGNMPASNCHPQCCYDIDNSYCFHRLPSRFSYLSYPQWTEEVDLRPRISTVPYAGQTSVPNLRLSIDEVSSTHLSLVFYDPEKTKLKGRRIDDKIYEYRVLSPESEVEVKVSEDVIFSTAKGPLIVSENIWEITFKLTDEVLYGLGELPLKPGTVKVLYNYNKGLSSLPLIYAKSNGSYHGLLIDMLAPTEIMIGRDNVIILRSITNSGLKLHLFAGPEPKDIMKDVMAFLGYNKNLEYWMLGAHVCR
jgi:hypothetical protein